MTLLVRTRVHTKGLSCPQRWLETIVFCMDPCVRTRSVIPLSCGPVRRVNPAVAPSPGRTEPLSPPAQPPTLVSSPPHSSPLPSPRRLCEPQHICYTLLPSPPLPPPPAPPPL